LGIKEKITEGISSFAGSPKNRINNLTIGTQKFNGAIIKPNEVASFADIVGEVDESQGYLPELVIKGTETIQELGGGMCQVSTTFYRAALNTGVPIIERRAHAYLVGYYKDGPDATVYVPSTDLKWKNDTGHYILIQTSVDVAKKKVTFSLWGTNDGRKVTVSAPTYTDIVPAPTEPYYVDDPTYPTGYLVEEEHPHEGATGTITRTITYPDGKTKTDTIKSTYKPWPAKMRRGTGPADLPIPPKE
jgi:vancomycin resistance protein YoaR